MPFATLEICVAQVGSFVAFCRLFVNLCCDTAYFNAQGFFFALCRKFLQKTGKHSQDFVLPLQALYSFQTERTSCKCFVCCYVFCLQAPSVRTALQMVQVSLLRMNEMVKNDMAKPLKTF